MGLIDVFYPKICVGCQREGDYICQACRMKLVTPDSICPMCSRLSLGGWVHPTCQTKDGIDRLLIGLPYRGMVQACLKKVKYKHSWDVIDFLVSLSHFSLSEGLLVPVPMYGMKERLRGFNQVQRIADLLSSQFSLEVRPVLVRTRDTVPMYGLSRSERARNVDSAFAFVSQLTQVPKLVLLIDDVWTTGATMQACTRVLKDSGVTEVWCLALTG
jgi:competence protein ComFC